MPWIRPPPLPRPVLTNSSLSLHTHLTVSSQLHLEALASSLARVYTLSPCFRAEHSQMTRHLAEFWMLEAEWAWTREINDESAASSRHLSSMSSFPETANKVRPLMRTSLSHRSCSLWRPHLGSNWKGWNLEALYFSSSATASLYVMRAHGSGRAASSNKGSLSS